MELKFYLFIFIFYLKHTYNRTIVELKYETTGEMASTNDAYNRTIVELKCLNFGRGCLQIETYNRTIVELKFK